MQTRTDIAEQIRQARASAYVVARNDMLRRVADGAYRNISEALEALGPPPSNTVTAAEVEAAIEGYVTHAASMRAFVAEHGAKWSERVRRRWLELAADREQKAKRLKGGP